MNTRSASSKSSNNRNINHFRIRMIAKLCILLVCAFQLLPRLILLCMGQTLNFISKRYLVISFSLFGVMVLVLAIEYILFRKKGPKVVKYSNVVDLIILMLFLCEWIFQIISSLQTINDLNLSFPIPMLFAFIGFAWRTLLVTLMVQKWYLKAITPNVVLAVAIGYAIHYAPNELFQILLRSVTVIVTLTIIFYCENKLKWKMMWMNLQQEKWIQVNNFILNNIPENIMILDFKGEARFISDYCKGFMESCGFSLDNNARDFFNRIENLHQLENKLTPSCMREKVAVQIERLTTNNELMRSESFSSLLRIETLQDLISNFRGMSESKSLQEREFLIYNGKLKLEDAKEKSIEIKISFVQNLQDEYIILILRDTTQRDLLVALEETNKYKDQLLASVSHELRTPLNGTINLVESAINSKKIPDVMKETLLVPALRSSKFLLHMINDILDMSQIKEKKLRLVFETEDLKETLKNTAQLVELQARKKGIDLLLVLDPNLPRNFCTDHIRLSQIVLNLINNAIKFTKEGGTVKLFAIPLDENCVQISVQDTGIGIAKENVKRLFSNYTHIEFEERQNMNPTGVGLGLNIAYSLAGLLGPDDHQGINVESVLDQGSTFTFIIENKGGKIGMENEEEEAENSINSRRVAEESPGIIKPKYWKIQRTETSISINSLKGDGPLIVPPSCSCPKVLVVDDNPFNIMAFETILSSLEMKCDSVYGGSCAIKRLLSREKEKCCQDCQSYSVVFIDQEMPEMNGSEAVQEIRRLQNENLISSSTRIIGCTAHQSKEEVEIFMKSGLDQCIYKPISSVIVKGILSDEISK